MVEGMLMMAVLLGGAGSADLVSILGAEDYFASRSIDAKGGRLIELAGAAPKDAKGEIVQLLAIRSLGAAKDPAAKPVLEKLAAGPKGFARDYALAALAKIDGKPAPAATRPKDSLRKDALAWFPADVDFFGGADLRGTPPKGHAGADDLAVLLQGLIPPQEREPLYKFAESVGNIRVDRVAFAVQVPEANGPAMMYFRITGEADMKRLAEFLTGVGMTVGECKEKDVTVLEPPAGGAGMPVAIVGPNDIVLAGFERRGGGRGALDALLAVRAGGKPSVVKGAFAKDIAALGDEAVSLLMGVPWPKMRDGLARSPVGAAPQNFALTMSAGETGMNVRFRGEAESAEAAAKFVTGFEDLRKEGLAEMDRAPRDVPPEMVKSMRAVLEGIKFTSDKAVIAGELAIPGDFAKTLLSMTLMRSPARPAPPVQRAVPAQPVEK